MVLNKFYLQFCLALFLPTLFGLAVSFFLNTYTLVHSTDWPWALLFFFSSSFILNIIYSLRRNKRDFAQLVFVCLILRLILAFLFIFAFSLLEINAFFYFAMHFLSYFVFYTIFEIKFVSLLITKKTKTYEN